MPPQSIGRGTVPGTTPVAVTIERLDAARWLSESQAGGLKEERDRQR
jgi:hypothetical protein